MNIIIRNQKSKVRSRKSDIVHRRRVLGTFLLAIALCLLSSIAISDDVTDGDVDKTRAVLE